MNRIDCFYNNFSCSKQSFTPTFKAKVINKNINESALKIASSAITAACSAGINNIKYTNVKPNNKNENIKILEAKIIELFEQGLSGYKISQILNLNYTKVIKILNKTGRKTKQQESSQKKYNLDLQKKLIEMVQNGISAKQAARDLKLDKNQASRILNRAGIKSKLQLQKEKINSLEFRNQVVALYNKGYNLSNISNETDVSPKVIRTILEEAGLKLPLMNLSSYMQNKIIALALEGYSSKEIAKQIGCENKHNEIIKILNKANIRTKTQQHNVRINSDEFRFKVIEMYHKKIPTTQIAKELSSSQDKILQILNEENIITKKQKERNNANNIDIRNKILELVKQGKTLDFIRKEIGISYISIKKILLNTQIN